MNRPKNPMWKKLKTKLSYSEKSQSFLDHLEALRSVLLRCVITVLVAMALCIPLARPLVRWLQAPLIETAEARGTAFELITTTPVEGFLQVVKVIFSAGLLLSLPLLLYFIALFVLPGLKPKEQKAIAIGGIFGTLLFAAGVAACYFITLPAAVNVMFYFNDYLGTVANWKIEKYLGFVLHLLIGFGLAFELPLVVIGLGRMGLLTPCQLRQYRRHVAVGILALAMLLTPPDIITQLQMAIPLYLLYECCIGILYLFERAKPKEGADS